MTYAKALIIFLIELVVVAGALLLVWRSLKKLSIPPRKRKLYFTFATLAALGLWFLMPLIVYRLTYF